MPNSKFVANYIAPPKTRESIRKDVFKIRRAAGFIKEPFFPIVTFLENSLPIIDPSFHLEVVQDKHMMGRLAAYYPALNVIYMRESVYNGACEDHYWHRMTLAHELGHYFYHGTEQICLARLNKGEKIPSNCDPERQAEIFAAELLMPPNVIKGYDYKQVADLCGVSFKAAKIQVENFKKKKPERKYRSGSH